MDIPRRKIDSLPEKSGENLRKASQPPKPAPKPDKSIFGGESEISARELREKLIKASPYIPGAGGAMYNLAERKKLAEEITKEYGSRFQKKNFEDTRMFRGLSKQRYNAKTSAERLEIDRKIRYLRREIEGKGK
jgi:hypothetical protein